MRELALTPTDKYMIEYNNLRMTFMNSSYFSNTSPAYFGMLWLNNSQYNTLPKASLFKSLKTGVQLGNLSPRKSRPSNKKPNFLKGKCQ